MAIPFSYNLRNLVVRRTSTMAAALGIGLVVAVFVLVLALAKGFAFAVQSTGLETNAIVLRKGSNAEITSGIEREIAESIAVRPEIAKDESGAAMVVAEVVTLVVLPRNDGADVNVTVRGTAGDRVLGIRTNVRLAAGRMFKPGLREIVVGRSISDRIRNLGLGDAVVFSRQDWKIVGIIESGGTGFESEIWGDAAGVQDAFRRTGVFSSMTFRLTDPTRLAALRTELESDPKYQVTLKTEAQYYADQAGSLSALIGILGTLITVIMAVGAVFGAMNTMYAAVGARAREVATLRALGFRRRAVLGSFLLESTVLSAIGGAFGCLLSLPIDGITTGTMNWDTFSELSFAFRITPQILGTGFVFAIAMGVVGGFLPAVRAARVPITQGLRQI
ncbi:MAG: ABC transporter permease [Planctomycetes bacterium]|nr:ABC transporter permease [Planctomycetota bacterium]MBI3845543.1 ABC transporter permease [Planctomycetota bacterium]